MAWRRFTRTLLLAALMGAITVQVGGALTAPRLTLDVTPDTIISGEGVLVYGQLSGPDNANAKILLHEEVDPATSFDVEADTTTEASGFYEFTFPVGTVATSRSWYVSGPGGSGSRTANERVTALLTLEASAGSGETSHPLTFRGRIGPAGIHSGEHVSLQEETGSSGWKTIAESVVDASSRYSIQHDFHTPGDYDLRALFSGDARNTKSWSDPVTAVVQQAENLTFTIASSNPAIAAGQAVTISGVLHAPGSSSASLGGASVTLWGHPYGAAFASIASTTTAGDGSYSFTQMPSRDGSYEVRAGSRRTAALYEAVHAVVTLSASATSSKVGDSVKFSGSVTPNEAGDVIDLEQMGTDGDFETVQSGVVDASSAYALAYTFGSSGAQSFRVVAPGGDTNANGISPTVAVNVTLPPLGSLPTLCTACVGRIIGPISVPPITVTKTVVTVTADEPMTFTFRLSTATQPKLVSDKPATELTVPVGDVTFKVTDAASAILSHTFEVCTVALPGPVKTLAAIEALPNGCSGTTAPPSPKVLGPGDSATMTIHFVSPGTYEYLSTVGGVATGDAFAGMKGVLNVT